VRAPRTAAPVRYGYGTCGTLLHWTLVPENKPRRAPCS
jgi:hypothetical protein